MTQTGAILYALAAFFVWVLVDVAIKLGAQASLSPFAVMAALGLSGTACIIAQALIKKTTKRLRPQRLRGQLLIAACSVGINFTNVIALKHLPLNIFYIVAFTAPLVTAVLSSLLKHESPTLLKIICLIAGFGGVILATASKSQVGGDWIGYLAGLSSVLAFAIYTVTMRQMAQSATAESTQLMNGIAVGAVGLIACLVQAIPIVDEKALGIVMVAGAINLIANLAYNKALHHTSSTNVAQLHYTQIITGALFAYLVFHEIPTENLIAGSIIIVVSGILVARQARQDEASMLRSGR